MWDVGQFNVKALEVIIHENYGARNGISNDICLVRVENMAAKKPDKCVDCYSPICLPPQGVDPQAGQHCWLAGWGATSTTSTGSNKLRDVGLNVMSHNYCKAKSIMGETDAFPVVESVEFCAGVSDRDGNGLTDPGRGACVGDGGGPFVCIVNNSPILCGMTSWGFHCGKEGHPTVMTKVSAFRDWIDQHINSQPSIAPPGAD